MSTWLISTPEGELLGEVEADNQADAVGLAEMRWAGRRGLLAWSKSGLERVGRMQQKTFRRERGQIAHHEAGHAVLARHLGLDLERVEIGVKLNESGSRFDPLADSFGRTVFDLQYSCSVEWGERRILAVMGGPMAEYRYRGKDDWDVLNRRRLKGSDRQWIDKQMMLTTAIQCPCDRPTPSDQFSWKRHERRCKPAYFELLRRRAAEALEARWPDIEVVARELERERSLDGAAVDALISGA